MEIVERDILNELRDRKETQQDILKRLYAIDRKVWVASGFLIAIQIGLQVFLKWVFK